MERVDKKITRLFFTSGLEIDVMSSYGNLNPLLIQAKCCYKIQFESFRNFFKQKEKILPQKKKYLYPQKKIKKAFRY